MTRGIILILFVACVSISHTGFADRINKGVVRRLVRKTNNLQHKVDELWTAVKSVNRNEKHEVNVRREGDTVKNLKSKMKNFLKTTRKDIEDEKRWCRESIKNLTVNWKDYQNGMSTTLQNFRVHQSELERENQALKLTLTELRNDNKDMKIENQALGQTIIDIRNGMQSIQSELSKVKEGLPCDAGWRYHRGHCYLAVITMKTWDDASAYCGGRLGYLIEINDGSEREFIHKDLLRDSATDVFWTGATNIGNGSQFLYDRTRQQVPGDYWAEDQPDNEGGDQRCVLFKRWSGIVELYDYNCSYLAYFICEKP